MDVAISLLAAETKDVQKLGRDHRTDGFADAADDKLKREVLATVSTPGGFEGLTGWRGGIDPGLKLRGSA